MELAARNAQLVLQTDRERLKREEGRTIGAVKEIAKLLGLENIVRMEAYDISNISGFLSVGSMVVYENGKPKRSDYRKFRIKTVEGSNDYASMEEVLTRRFEHGMEEKQQQEEKNQEEQYGSFTKFPDLILMDGGKGQVHSALSVLEKLKLEIPVCGMVKDDKHRTRGLYYQNQEIPIEKDSEAFRLITRIQDEAHRFAIEYHRSLRSKIRFILCLMRLKGLSGKKKSFDETFYGCGKNKRGNSEELAEVSSMNEKSAQAVYDFFHKANA